MIQLTPLGDVAEVFNGKTPSKTEQRDSGHPVLKIKDVKNSGQFTGTFNSFVDDEFLLRHGSKAIKKDDSLILNAAHNADYVGTKQYRAETSVEGAIATGEWLIVRANRALLSPAYLHHWLSSPATRFKMKFLVKGIHLYPKDIQRMFLSLPSMEEQKRIAAILDKADAIRRKRQQAIELADKFLRSVFLHYGCEPISLRIPRNFQSNPNWQWVNLQDVAKLESGHTPNRKRQEYWECGNIKWLSLKDIKQIDGIYVNDTEDKPNLLGIDNSSARVLPKGTVALCRTASVGNCVILGDEMATSQDFVDWICGDRILPEFLYTVLKSSKPEFDRLKQGSTHKTIYVPTVKEFCVYLPPIEIQEKIAEITRWLSKFSTKLKRSALKEDELFASISQRCFIRANPRIS